MAYRCRIAEINDGREFYICANNFRVDQDPVQQFEDESFATACAHTRAPEPKKTRKQEDWTRIYRIILEKEQTKKILLSYDGKALRLRMRTDSLKTSPPDKTKIRYQACMGNG